MKEPTFHTRSVRKEELDILIETGRKTFTETFAGENDPVDLQNYLDTSFSRAKIWEELHTEGSYFYFAVGNEQIAGYLKLNTGHAQTEMLGENHLEVERLYILRQFQGLGAGRMLMNFAFDKAVEMGKNYVWLGVWEHNEKAMKFYHSFGFKEFGRHTFMVGTDSQTDILLKAGIGLALLKEGIYEGE